MRFVENMSEFFMHSFVFLLFPFVLPFVYMRDMYISYLEDRVKREIKGGENVKRGLVDIMKRYNIKGREEEEGDTC